jgi:hypothetical protein
MFDWSRVCGIFPRLGKVVLLTLGESNEEYVESSFAN